MSFIQKIPNMNRISLTKGAGLLLLAGSITLFSCGENNAAPAAEAAEPSAAATEAPAASEEKLFEEVSVPASLDASLAEKGKTIYEMKCQSCHKLTDEKLVGPGWKGITQRRSPGWIVAMTTKPEVMIAKDPDAQKLLEEHLVAMPNQNISADEARQLLEFMRSNDGVK